MANTMEIQRKSQDGVAIFTLVGSLDAISAPDTGKKLLAHIDEGDTKIVMDLSGLNYISSAGLQTILKVTRKIKTVDGGFVLASLTSNVKDVIELSGFTVFLSIFDNVESAIKSL
jgi:anti-anti-sigma factor